MAVVNTFPARPVPGGSGERPAILERARVSVRLRAASIVGNGF